MRHARPDYNRFQDPAGKVPDDEPVFLLRAQDPDAAEAVRYYSALLRRRAAKFEDEPQAAIAATALADTARSWSIEMEGWPVKKAIADLPPAGSSEAVRPVIRVAGADNLEPVFLLRGISVGAEDAMRLYADTLARAGANPQAIEWVRLQADRMASWPRKALPNSAAAYTVEDPKGTRDVPGVL